MIKLFKLRSLIKTPDFDGLPNLQTFVLRECSLLEEIHPSFGHLENLVYVRIESCYSLKMLPPITRSMKLETFVVSQCKSAFNLSRIQKNMENCVPYNMNHIGLWFISECLRKLDLSWCNMGDGDMIRSGADLELPNLQELNLERNRFVRLDFSVMRLPRLKWLNVTYCRELVELWELPSSIAVVIANYCESLKSFGDISNCKWLWKVLLWGKNKLDPLGGDILLNSMLKGNAKDYFISIILDNLKWRSVLWVDWVEPYSMPLPHDWYNDFFGILMFVSFDNNGGDMDIIKISIKQGLDEDFQSQLWHESNQRPDIDSRKTYVGYVSFSSLRHTGCFNSTYNFISFFLEDYEYLSGGYGYRFRVVLVPKDNPMQTTKVAADSSEFWDEKEVSKKKTFTIFQHDSNSCIKILWKPLHHLI